MTSVTSFYKFCLIFPSFFSKRVIYLSRLTFILFFFLFYSFETFSQSFAINLGGKEIQMVNSNRSLVTNNGNSGLSAGSVWRYDDLISTDGITVYGLLTILEMNNASISSLTYLDDETDGVPNRFQPRITTGSGGGYISFKLEFFELMTNQNVYISNYYMTGVDIDGQEFYEISGYSSYIVDATCVLGITPSTIQTPGTRFAALNNGELSGVTFDNTRAFIAKFPHPATIIYFVMGAAGTYTNRQFSAQFGSMGGTFSTIETQYNPNPVLTISKTASPTVFSPGSNGQYTVSVSNAGNTVTSVTVTDALPSDIIYIPNSTTVLIPASTTSKTVRDEFTTTPVTYTEQDGIGGFWTTNWLDNDNNAASGTIYISGGKLTFANLIISDAIERTANLYPTGSTSGNATLSFDYTLAGSLGTSSLTVQLSTDGVNYTSVETFTGANTSGTFTYTLPAALIGNNTRLRFANLGTAWNSASKIVTIDNIQIAYNYSKPDVTLSNSTGTLTDGNPAGYLVAPADAITLEPNVTMSINFNVAIGCAATGTKTNTATTSCSGLATSVTATHSAQIGPVTTGTNYICSPPGTAVLTASGAGSGQIYRWYSAATGGTLLYTGNPFTTPSISSNTTYYVAIYTTASGCESTRIPVDVSISPAVTGTGVITSSSAQNGSNLSTSANPASSATNNNAAGTVSWTNPTNVYTSDNNRATATMAVSTISNYLDLTGFGLSVPSISSIVGIEVQIEKSAGTSTRVYDNLIQLMVNGTPVGSDLKNTTAWPTTEASTTYGGSTNLWGRTWTASEISNLGLRIQANRNSSTGNVAANIDYVTIKVYYTAFSDNQSSLQFTATGYSNATNYAWTIPSGASYIGTSTGTTIYLNLNGAGQNGTYTVCTTPSNICNTGSQACATIAIANSVNNYISGYVYNDTNGSSGSNKVDGTGINNIGGQPIYATLVASGVTVSTQAINSDGSYRFDYLSASTSYSIWITSTIYGTGTTPVASLPAGGSFNGEINNNAANSLTGNDGTTDGKVTGLTAGEETNVNFGVALTNPTAVNDNSTTNEDTPVTFSVTNNDTPYSGHTINVATVDLDPETSGQQTSFSVAGQGTFTVDNSGNVTFTPYSNYNGTVSIQYVVNDDSGITSNEATITVVVNPVNDAPSFVKGTNQAVCVGSGVQTVASWASSISTGPSNESLQLLTFNITGNTNTSVFSSQPTISSTGTLSYSPHATNYGTATITVVLQDDGGTLFGGVDTSSSQTFTITVNGNSTITQTSVASTNPQTTCINNAITPVTFSVGGAGTGASITSGSLPAGVTGSFSSGVFTISGTPTVAGTFTYTVTTSGGSCSQASISGSLTVQSVVATAAISGTTSVCVNATNPGITFTGANGTAPYTFFYTVNSGSVQSVTTSSGNTTSVNQVTNVAGTYVYNLVSVRDASSSICSNAQSGTVTVTVNALPTTTYELTPVSCYGGNDGKIKITGVGGAGSYYFSINNGTNYTITPETTHTFTGLSANSFTIKVKDTNGCVSAP